MKKVISSEKRPIKMWLDDIETSALDQAKNLANLPFIFKHVALMPDAHRGYGMPIGGVIATKDVIIPNAVGVDIGCGMAFARTNLLVSELADNDIKLMMSYVRSYIPIGLNGKHQKNQTWEEFSNLPLNGVIEKELENAIKSLATLGSGNHFIEFQKDENGFLCFMLHSGSRNLGYKIAKYHHNVAKKLCEEYYSDIPTNELAFLPIFSKEGQDYFADMKFALKFAKESRLRMLNIMICSAIVLRHDTEILDTYDVHHNYARWENHFGKNVIVHRKGATSAQLDEIGIIPGSQGTSSYIVKGKGNPDSFKSCSHGAGRKMSRTAAKKDLNLQDEIAKLDELGVVHSIRSEQNLDEASGAYKNIDTVMNNQSDLVSIVNKLTPLAVIKG